ncbi:MAG: sugar ABC transporter permease [Lachnospiraceae bacterium]|nr:sugar ABC transporter permease [Lachnospiraceae bacterium]
MRGGLTREKKKKLRSWLFLAPSLLGVLLFFVAPFFVVIWYSMVNNPVQHEFVGFTNYFRVAANEAHRLAVFNTIRFSLTAVPLAVLLSLTVAVIMEASIPYKSFFRSCLLSPMMVPVASIVLIWQVLFHYNGLVNELLGIRLDWLKSNHAQVVIVLLFLWKNLGYNMILFMSALASVPKDLIEVARIEGAGRGRVFFQIKLRYLSATILFVTIMSVLNSFKVFRETYLMTGEYPFDALYLLQHFMNNTFISLDYQKLSAAAVMMSLLIVVLVGALFIVEDRFGRDIDE